jgi:UDP-N-acetylmuramate dehydrogenase
MNAAHNDRHAGGQLLHHEPMARHTSWRVGGPADVLFKPADLDSLVTFLRELPTDTPVHWVGLGSNLLVRDGGVRGVVILTGGFLKTLERIDAITVRAGAGLSCATFARRCVRWAIGPAAFFAGIPGTIGGALAMNAGAFGGETWDRVASVQTLDRFGEVRTRERDEYTTGYRQVAGSEGEWFLAATFAFEQDVDADRASMKAMLARRSASQPVGRPSCGSVFRNPPNDHAGRLIEAAGLKGARMGGAEVSTKHANFIINDGTATAADIEALIDHIRAVVKKRSGVELALEVRVIGESAT